MASHPSRRNYRVLRLDARRRVLLHATPVAAVRLSKRMDRLEIFTACPSLRQGDAARERARAAVVRSIPSVHRSGDRIEIVSAPSVDSQGANRVRYFDVRTLKPSRSGKGSRREAELSPRQLV